MCPELKKSGSQMFIFEQRRARNQFVGVKKLLKALDYIESRELF